MPTLPQTTLGNIYTSNPGSPALYAIACYLEKTCKINFILLDEYGNALWEQKILYQKGQSNINLALPVLKPGNYNCWIEINGKMHIRPLQIAPQKRSSVLGNWMKHFS